MIRPPGTTAPIERPAESPSFPGRCVACGRLLDGDGRVPDGYQWEHCSRCADEIERRDWNRQSGVTV